MDLVHIPVRGHLRVYTVNTSGEETLVSDKKNQITYLHLDTLVRLITQQAAITNVAELAFYKMDIESGGVAFNPVTPNDTGPDINAAIAKSHVFNKATDILISGTTPGLVQFRAELDPADAIGQEIRAAGIYTQGDGAGGAPRLVCRELTTVFTKEAGLGARFEWDIQFVIA